MSLRDVYEKLKHRACSFLKMWQILGVKLKYFEAYFLYDEEYLSEDNKEADHF